MNNKKDTNFLEYIPEHNPVFQWENDEQGVVTILVEHKGFFDRFVQKYYNKPKVTRVQLEEMGSFIWPLIDGKRNILEIGEFVKDYFGEKAEPLYPRLAQYMKLLEKTQYIKLNKKV